MEAKPHTVFISASSQDRTHAIGVHGFLAKHGIQAFYSEVSLGRLANTDYRREIDQALMNAEHLVVVTSSTEKVCSPWVEAEWGLFLNEKRSGRKRGNIITVIFDEMRIVDL